MFDMPPVLFTCAIHECTQPHCLINHYAQVCQHPIVALLAFTANNKCNKQLLFYFDDVPKCHCFNFAAAYDCTS